MVWEYVVNSLQYVDPGVSPKIQVRVEKVGKKHRIVISDNGRGMNVDGLRNFFRMHGENIDRVAGHVGRGKFGTGKSAAFGIATSLQVQTVNNGFRNIVELTRDMINDSRGDEIPINWLEMNAKTNSKNGTTIVISNIYIKECRIRTIVEYIERHLQAFRTLMPEVAVNNHICTYREPEISEECKFTPSPKQVEIFGNVELIIKVARAPLTSDEQGITIFSGINNLVAVEDAGVSSKEFGNYLFGEICVPAIETYDSVIEPYDTSRSLKLNPHHPLVPALIGFIGSKLDEVRKRLVQKSKEAKKTEQARRLAIEAEKISDILNKDFQNIKRQLQDIRTASTGLIAPANKKEKGLEIDKVNWTQGTQQLGNIHQLDKTLSAPRRETEVSDNKDRKNVTSSLFGELDDLGTSTVDPISGKDSKRNSKGGFRVEYRNLGKSEERSRYDANSLSILINLDHPVIAAALGSESVESPAFRRLSYEIAFSEYSMGLGYEISKQDSSIPPDDLL